MLEISLAEWSFHRAIESGELANLDFPRIAREQFDIGAVELVNALMEGHDARTIAELRRRADDHGVRILLIMCDDEGDLSDPDAAARRTAAENHHKWVDAAAALGCHAIRVNTGGEQHPLDLEAVARCAESCSRLVEYASPRGIAVLLENHGGISGRLDLLLDLLRRVKHPHFGTLPDFGNPVTDADPYEVVSRLMPRAKAVSAKCADFDDTTGEETTIDFARMIGLVRDAGYEGFVGIEYEGDRLAEAEGVRRARDLLERLIGA